MMTDKNRQLTKPVKISRNLPVNYFAGDREFYEDYREYETNSCYLKSVNNVFVTFDSIIYRKGILLSESLYSKQYKSYYQFRYPFKMLLFLKKVVLNPGKKYLLVTDTESAGHYHWLTEALPRLLSLKEFCGQFVLMLPDKPYIRNIALESLRMANLNFEDIFLMKESEYYAVKDLYYVSKVSGSGQMHDELMRELNSLFISGKERLPNKRIYISREKAGFRKILNEKEFTALLKNHGFEVFYGEDSSFSEQVEIFAGCKTLVGVHGAGLTNCLFMNPGGNIVELRKNEINLAYWRLADSLDHKYYYYNGVPDSEKSIIGRGCNLTIPVKDFEANILQKLQD